MDRYIARMNLHGATQRERAKNRLVTSLQDKVVNSLSYKAVKINGVDTYLVINSGTQAYYKDFTTLPNQNINIGDYVEWAHSFWIVTTCDSDDEIYRDGKLVQCNYLLKWQNEDGDIIERWAVIQSASKYNDGNDGGYVITLGSDQLSVIIPLDSESIKLKKSMGKKFFIDNNKDNPTAYELTGTGNVPDTYNGYGVTSWIVKECAYTASKDDLKYGVCDYMSNNCSTLPPNVDETTNLFASISGVKNIKCGFPRTYTAVFANNSGNNVNTVDFDWNIISDFEINYEIKNDKIELFVDDEALIGASFLLQILIGNEVMAYTKVGIEKGF